MIFFVGGTYMSRRYERVKSELENKFINFIIKLKILKIEKNAIFIKTTRQPYIINFLKFWYNGPICFVRQFFENIKKF